MVMCVFVYTQISAAISSARCTISLGASLDCCRSARHVAGIALQFLFELLEQRERVRGRTREAGEDLAALEGPNLVRVRLHHGIAERDLAVAAQGDVAVAAYRENGGATDMRNALGCA